MSETKYHSSKSPPTSVSCCSSVSAELKLYQAFIFSVPIFFTFILLFFFYLFYLRRRRADWSSLRMRTARLVTIDNNNLSTVSPFVFELFCLYTSISFCVSRLYNYEFIGSIYRKVNICCFGLTV